MLKATFDIIPDSIADGNLQNNMLLMEVSDQIFCYVLYNRESQRFLGFRQYNLDFIPGKTPLEALSEILSGDEHLQRQFADAYLVYHYTDSNLIPEKFFAIDLNKPITEIVYGNARKGLLLNDKVQGWDLYNIYRIPREVHSLLQQKFAAGNYWHYNTLLLSGVDKESLQDDTIKVVVAADKFAVVAFKGQQLQLAQSYHYQTPEDVSFQLLALALQFGIDQESVNLKVSGLMDEQSILYQELLKYFHQLEWEQLPDETSTEEGFENFPSHYFSPLLKMALCV
ncbi:DUF3822 family protein [Pseudoflavitalea rhizosphaerae]|uniref:DUF3822 family protein n=1 Tax=Pseudoflavitalea rhizosphaerae TaxID=1884793 RepID=UPI000F8F63A7|nr:DUF3822 family protein [Pseudoflavitalea rhizosphaerae]